MGFIAVLATLCFVTWSLAHAMQGPVSSCCPGWSTTRVPVKKIKNYTIQLEGVCPVTAIVFQTFHGNRICSDPNSDWAKKAIVTVDEKERGSLQMEQNTQATTRYFTSAAAAPTKKAPVKKCRNGRRRRLRRKLRNQRKGQRKVV